jgi:DMSO/TMAO reductase YedYZ molybdopterin-dependent catalytic subunit
MKRSTASKLRPFIGISVVVAVVSGFVLFAVARNSSPTEDYRPPGGSEVEVTATDEMRVRTAEGQPEIDLESYRLVVDGLVGEELSLTYEEIQGIGADERYAELPCVEGWTEKGVWRGTRLQVLLEMAGVDDEARTVVFHSPNGYTTSLTVEDVEETDPLLAYGVNGERLPEEQGYPLRLVVPDRLGYKWIKWLDRIEVIAGEYEGFWEKRGYSNEADATDR